MAQTRDGGCVLTGAMHDPGDGQEDLFLIKTDSGGNETRTWTFGETNEDVGSSLAQTSDGGFILVGYAKSFGAGAADIYLVKTEREGNVMPP